MPNRIPRALKSSLAGKHKQKNGARFESALQTAFQFVGNVFGDIVEKTPEPLRVLRRGNGNTLTAFFAKKAQPDFKGALKSQGGRAFVAEAKSTEGKAISFALVKSHLFLHACNCFLLLFGYKLLVTNGKQITIFRVI